MQCNPGGVGIMSSVKDDGWSSLLTVGLAFDEGVCRCSLRTLNGKRCESNGQCRERGVLCTRDDGKDGDADVNVDADDLSIDTLGKMKDGGSPNPWKADGLLTVR